MKKRFLRAVFPVFILVVALAGCISVPAAAPTTTTLPASSAPLSWHPIAASAIAFMSGNGQQTVDQGISIARQQHDQYTAELARLLGLTVMPATAAETALSTETPKP